jgi:Ca-activated chloride channel family protein
MKRIGLLFLFMMIAVVAWGQNERKVIRQGVRAYKDGEFSNAEVQFRKAEDINQESFEAEFNTGAALYGQEKYVETAKQYESLAEQSKDVAGDDPETVAHIWHNMGNSLLEAQQYAPSIEAYKNSLRLNPEDQDSKYNLAYAKQKLKEQEQDGENEQKDQQEQEKQQNEEDQEKKQDNPDQQQEQDEQKQEQQPAPREISKEDAERILQAIQQQEKVVKEKVDKEKAAAAKVKTEKDW